MRKILSVLCVAVFISLACACNSQNESANLFTVTGTIISDDCGNYKVEVSDGEIYCFISSDDFEIGEEISVEFNSLGTASIYDDQIISVVRVQNEN